MQHIYSDRLSYYKAVSDILVAKSAGFEKKNTKATESRFSEFLNSCYLFMTTWILMK